MASLSNVCWSPWTLRVKVPGDRDSSDPSQEERINAVVKEALDSREKSLENLCPAIEISDSAKVSDHLGNLLDQCSLQSIYFDDQNYRFVDEVSMPAMPEALIFEGWKRSVSAVGNFELGDDATLVDKQKEKIFDALLSFGICCYQKTMFPGFQNWLKEYADGALYVGPEAFAIAAQYGNEELLQLLWDKSSSKTMPRVLEEAVYISSIYESQIHFVLYEKFYEDNIATCKTSRLIELGKGVISQDALLACLGKVCGQPQSRKENYSSMGDDQKKYFHRSRKIIYSLISAIEKNDFQSIVDSWESAWERFKAKKPSLLDRGTIFSKLILIRNVRKSFLDELSKESCRPLYEKLGDLIQALQTCRFRDESLQEKFQSMGKLDELIQTLYQKDCENLYLMLSQMKLQWHFGVALSQLITTAFRESEKNLRPNRDHEMWVKLRRLILSTPTQSEPRLKTAPPISESLNFLAKAVVPLGNPSKVSSSSKFVAQHRKKRKNASEERDKENVPDKIPEAPRKAPRKRIKPSPKEVLPAETLSSIPAGPKSASSGSSASAPVAIAAIPPTDSPEISRSFRTLLTVEDGNCMVDAIALWLIRKGAQRAGQCPDKVRAILPQNGSLDPEREIEKRQALRTVLRQVGCEKILSWEMNESQTIAIIGAIKDALERDPKAKEDPSMQAMGFLLEDTNVSDCDQIFRGELQATYVNYIKQDRRYLDGPFLLAMNELFEARVQVFARSQQRDGRWINHVNLAAPPDGVDPITIFRVQKTKHYGQFGEFAHTVEHYLGVNWMDNP